MILLVEVLVAGVAALACYALLSLTPFGDQHVNAAIAAGVGCVSGLCVGFFWREGPDGR